MSHMNHQKELPSSQSCHAGIRKILQDGLLVDQTSFYWCSRKIYEATTCLAGSGVIEDRPHILQVIQDADEK